MVPLQGLCQLKNTILEPGQSQVDKPSRIRDCHIANRQRRDRARPTMRMVPGPSQIPDHPRTVQNTRSSQDRLTNQIISRPSQILDHPRTVTEHRTFSVQNGSQIMVGHTEGTIIIVEWLYFYYYLGTYYLVLTTTVPAFPPGTTTICIVFILVPTSPSLSSCVYRSQYGILCPISSCLLIPACLGYR